MNRFLLSIVGFGVTSVAAQQCVATGRPCGELEEGSFTGCCDEADACNFHFPFYSECGKPLNQCKPKFTQCGGEAYDGETQCCDVDAVCEVVSASYSECRPMQYDLNKQACDLVPGIGEDNYPNVDATGVALEHGRLRVEGVQLVNEAGDPFQLRGLNVNRVPSTDCNTVEAMRFMVENWGANMLRVGIDDWAYIENRSVVDVLYQQIDDAMALGVYVVVYMNNGQPSPYDYIEGEAGNETGVGIDFHLDLATRYGDSPQFILDIFNEPWSGNWVEGWQELKNFAELLIPLVREIAPDTIMFLPTNWWNQNFHVVRTNELDETYSHNIMYKFTFYTGSHDIYLNRLIKYSQLVPLVMPKFGMSEWFGDNLYQDVTQRFTDIFNKYTLSWGLTDMSEGTTMNQIWRPGTCDSQEWTNLTCTGVLMKSWFVQDSFPPQCAAEKEQCGGFGVSGPQSCCDETNTCVVWNETYSECAALGYTCATSYSQCGGLDAQDETVSSGCCDPQDVCVAVSDTYSQCVPQELPVECAADELELGSISGRGFAETTGRLHVENRRLVDAAGAIVQLRGVSLSLIQEQSNCADASNLQQAVDDWGMNAIRIPVGADNVGDVDLQDIFNIVDTCDDLGVYCVISLYLQSEGNPLGIYDAATDFWIRVATALGTKDNVIFELLSQSFAANNDLEDFYNVRSFIGDFMPTFRGLTENPVFIGISNGFDVYMPHTEHIDDANTVNTTYAAIFHAGKERDVKLIDTFSQHTVLRGILISELHLTDGESTGLYPLAAQKLVDVLDLKAVGYFFPGFEDSGLGLLAENSCSEAVLQTTCTGQFARQTVAGSVTRVDGVVADSLEPGSGGTQQQSDDDDDDDEITTIVVPVVMGVAILALVAVIFTRKPQAAQQDNEALEVKKQNL